MLNALEHFIPSALLGAGAGAGIGALTSDDEDVLRDVLRDALIGSAAGGILGTGKGYLLSKLLGGKNFLPLEEIKKLITTKKLEYIAAKKVLNTIKNKKDVSPEQLAIIPELSERARNAVKEAIPPMLLRMLPASLIGGGTAGYFSKDISNQFS